MVLMFLNGYISKWLHKDSIYLSILHFFSSWPAKPNIFTLWSLKKKFADPLILPADNADVASGPINVPRSDFSPHSGSNLGGKSTCLQFAVDPPSLFLCTFRC